MKEYTATFNGKRYKVDVEPHDGYCEHPDSKGLPRISFPYGLRNNRKSLDLMIHEMLHACNWYKKEETVDKTATDIARALWRMGWRLEE